MLVFEVMTKDPVTVRPGTSIKDALALLSDNHVTALPVATSDGKIRGVVSEADLIRELLPAIRAPMRFRRLTIGGEPTVVEDVMSPHPVTVHPETDLAEAVELLTSTTVKSVPVVDRQGYLKGVLSRSDIVRLLARADDDIQREVDELLRSTGLKDWLVDVQDGAVQLLGPEDSDDTLVARLLAATVPGVLDVSARTEHA